MVLNGRIKTGNVAGDLRAIPVTSKRCSTAKVGISGGLEELVEKNSWCEVNDGATAVRWTCRMNALRHVLDSVATPPLAVPTLASAHHPPRRRHHSIDPAAKQRRHLEWHPRRRLALLVARSSVMAPHRKRQQSEIQ